MVAYSGSSSVGYKYGTSGARGGGSTKGSSAVNLAKSVSAGLKAGGL